MSYTNGLDNPELYFQTKLYTGNATDDTTISGVGFQSDLTWIKSRGDASWHQVTDSVRGVGNVISTNSSGAESNFSSLKSWNSDGFVLSANSNFNGNGVTFASWNWKANGAGSSNTDGSITSTVSANTTSGFSIVKYTAGSSGANSDTIGHGLNSVPSMIILKTTTATDSWVVYHKSNGAGKSMVLNNNTAVATNANIFPTAPTSSTFYPGNTATTNSSSRSYIAYCFADVQGYSKVSGSYVGNGSTDGTYVHLGFTARWLMIKKSSASGSGWMIFDTKRNPTNDGATLRLPANANSSEATDHILDILSNGFKIRDSDATLNTSGATFIYMAFAESPFVTSTGVPATAR